MRNIRRDDPPSVKADATRVASGVEARAKVKAINESIAKREFDLRMREFDLRMRDTMPDAQSPTQQYFKEIHDEAIKQQIGTVDRATAKLRAEGLASMGAAETGWGEKTIPNNPLGVKEWKKGTGILTDTHEYEGGKKVPQKLEFKKFPSDSANIAFGLRQIEKDARYKIAKDATDFDTFAEGMKKWSTNEKYPELLKGTRAHGTRRKPK